jgi:transketolase
MTGQALEAAEMLEKEGIQASVANLHTIKPLDGEFLIRMAKDTGAVVTAEEHSILGGLGGAVAEFLAENFPLPVVRVGIQDTFGESGTPRALLQKYGLTPESLVLAGRKALKLKNSPK